MFVYLVAPLLCNGANVFDKPRAESGSQSVCAKPRRESDCSEETKD